MHNISEGTAVVVTTVKYFGRYTETWRGTFFKQYKDHFTILSDEGELSFNNDVSVRVVE